MYVHDLIYSMLLFIRPDVETWLELTSANVTQDALEIQELDASVPFLQSMVVNSKFVDLTPSASRKMGWENVIAQPRIPMAIQIKVVLPHLEVSPHNFLILIDRGFFNNGSKKLNFGPV